MPVRCWRKDASLCEDGNLRGLNWGWIIFFGGSAKVSSKTRAYQLKGHEIASYGVWNKGCLAQWGRDLWDMRAQEEQENCVAKNCTKRADEMVGIALTDLYGHVTSIPVDKHKYAISFVEIHSRFEKVYLKTSWDSIFARHVWKEGDWAKKPVHWKHVSRFPGKTSN